jgi:hypothetical protein
VGEDGVPEGRVEEFSHHSYLHHRHDLAALDAQNRAAQGLTGVGVHHGLHETPGLVDFERPGHLAHRHLRNVRVAALIPSLLLAQPDPSKLRVYKHRVGNEAVGD